MREIRIATLVVAAALMAAGVSSSIAGDRMEPPPRPGDGRAARGADRMLLHAEATPDGDRSVRLHAEHG